MASGTHCFARRLVPPQTPTLMLPAHIAARGVPTRGTQPTTPLPPAFEPPTPPMAAPPEMAWSPQPMVRPSNAVVIILVGLAAALLLAGVVVLQARALPQRPDFQDFTDPEQYNAALEAWQRGVLLLTFLGGLLLDLGVFLFLLGGFLVGFLRSDLPEGVRRAAIVMPVVLAVFWLLAFFFASSIVPIFP